MLLVVQGYTVVRRFRTVGDKILKDMQASRKSISKGRQLSNCVYESQDALVESGSRAATESKTIAKQHCLEVVTLPKLHLAILQKSSWHMSCCQWYHNVSEDSSHCSVGRV